MHNLVKGLEGRTETVILGGDGGPALVIATKLGAKILGASVDGLQGDNLFWVNPAVTGAPFWAREKMDWNAGGWRSWLAPEDAFYLDEQNTWFVPAEFDPGAYVQEHADGRSARFRCDFSLTSRAGDRYDLTLVRDIQLVDPPRTALPSTIGGGVRRLEVDFTHTLINRGARTLGGDVPAVDLWSILQLNPPGTMIVPYHSGVGSYVYRDYFDPIPEDRVARGAEAVTVKIDGRRRGKLGFHPDAARPFIAYLGATPSGGRVLFVKQFAVDPQGLYLDKPWGKPSETGDAVQLYNDDGAMGGFGEIEAHGPGRDVLRPFKGKLLVFLGQIKNFHQIFFPMS